MPFTFIDKMSLTYTVSLLFFTSDGEWENNRCGRYLKGGQITLEDETDSEF